MANSWFRLYAEFASDPKVQMMPETYQRRLIMVLCMRCNGDVTLQDEEVAFQLRISNEEWQKTKEVFISKNFMSDDGEITNWDKRQFVSDSSAARVAKHREKKKQACNVTVTPPEQNRTDTEHTKTIVRSAPSRFSEFWALWPKSPRKVGKAASEKKWKARRLDESADQILEHVKAMVNTQQWKDGFEPAPLTYINQSRWVDEVINAEGKPGKAEKPWFLTAPGIEAKAVELNVSMLQGEKFPNFKERVYHAAGLTPEAYRKAKIDHEGRA